MNKEILSGLDYVQISNPPQIVDKSSIGGLDYVRSSNNDQFIHTRNYHLSYESVIEDVAIHQGYLGKREGINRVDVSLGRVLTETKDRVLMFAPYLLYLSLDGVCRALAQVAKAETISPQDLSSALK